MKQSIASKNRKELENKMAKVFEKDMKTLPFVEEAKNQAAAIPY